MASTVICLAVRSCKLFIISAFFNVFVLFIRCREHVEEEFFALSSFDAEPVLLQLFVCEFAPFIVAEYLYFFQLGSGLNIVGEFFELDYEADGLPLVDACHGFHRALDGAISKPRKGCLATLT